MSSSLGTSAPANEATPLLSGQGAAEIHAARPRTQRNGSHDQASVEPGRFPNEAPSSALDFQAKRILSSVFVASFLIAFGHYVAISSIMDLIRGLSCQEYYRSHPPKHLDADLTCSLVEIEDRTSTVFSYMLSINSLVSCFSALTVAPWLLKRLGRQGTMLIAVLVPTVELFVIASIPNRFNASLGGSNWVSSSPTTSLRLLLAEAFAFGLIGCPDTLIGIVSQAIVLDTVPSHLRSTWLARLSSCTFLGMLISTIVLRSVTLNTTSDMISDTLPIRLGALVSTLAPLWCLLTLPRGTSSAISASADSGSRSTADPLPTQSNEQATFRTRLANFLAPIHLLWPVKSNEADGVRSKRDWRLTKLIIAATMCDQIALTTNTQMIYVQARFGLHAQDLSLVLGLVGSTKWVFLVLIFPWLAGYARRLYRHAVGADRMLAIVSLLFDMLAWTVMIVGGTSHNLRIFYSGIMFYVLAAANVSSITSIASALLPEGVSVDELAATLSSLANVMSTIGPVLNASIYRIGLRAGFPEMVFALTAAISLGAAALVASTSLSM